MESMFWVRRKSGGDGIHPEVTLKPGTEPGVQRAPAIISDGCRVTVSPASRFPGLPAAWSRLNLEGPVPA